MKSEDSTILLAAKSKYNFNVPDYVELNTRNILPILILTGVFCGLAVWMVVPAPPVGFLWDDTWYLLMAEWLSGRPEYQELAWNMLRMRQYPPIWSLVLSLSGATLEDQHNAFILNAIFLGVGIGVAMVWFTREGFSTATTAIAGAILLFNPVALLWLPTLFSEHLYILLTTLVLALAGVKRDSKYLWLAIGLIAGLAGATRNVGWALVPAIVFSLALQRRYAPLLPFMGGLAMSALTIPFFKAGLPPAMGYLHGFAETFGNLGPDYLVRQTRALTDGWLKLWGSGVGALAAAVMVIPGLVIRLRNRCADAWYVVAYLAVLIAWPFPEHMPRLLWPLLPFFLVAANSALLPFRRGKHSISMVAVVFGILFLASVPHGMAKSLDRLWNPPVGELFELSRMTAWTRSGDRQTGLEILQARRQFLDDMERVSRTVGGDECIYSELPSLVAARARRIAQLATWETLDALDISSIQCRFYYMIPSVLANTGPAEIAKFGTMHREVFRTRALHDPEGTGLMAVFFELRTQRRQTN